ncbi:hypothetical protein D3C80_1502300 [compost metagenome]
MKRTGSIASYVGPAVISIFFPLRGSLLSKSASRKETMCSGSAIRPSPDRPLANSPLSAGIMVFPNCCNASKLAIVDGCLYMSKSIAGAK